MNGLDLLYLVSLALLGLEIVRLRFRVRELERFVRRAYNIRYGRVMQAHPKSSGLERE